MRKLSLYILSVLLFCNFTNIVNAKVDGEGELHLSEGTVKKFIQYIRIDDDREPDVFYITLDGTASTYFWCKKGNNCEGNTFLDIKDCENYYDKKCKIFAKKRIISWKNNINPGKGKVSEISKNWSDEKISEKLVELGFLDNNKTTEVKTEKKKSTKEKVVNAKNMCDVSEPYHNWTMCTGSERDVLNKFLYFGEWKDGAFHGQGTWTHESGEEYVGEWKFGNRSGQGTLIFPDGYKYVGEFKGNTFNGQGTATLTDGTKESGIWKNGEILSKKEAKTGNQTQVYNYTALNKSRRLIFLKKDPTTFKNIIFQKEINIRTSKVEKTSQLNKGFEKNFKGFRFIAEYEDNIKIEILIEYDKSVKDLKKAEKKALYFADMFGQMPHILKLYNDKIFVHRDLGKGSKIWWASPSLREFHINEFTCGDYLSYGKDNYSQCSSMMIHELAHVLQNYTSVIPPSKWKKARKLDNKFYCSKYAKKNIYEDFAESVLCWIGVKYRKDHLHKSDIKKIDQFIPNRLKFFDDLNLNMYPYKISN